MIKVKDGKISLNKTKTLTPKQLALMKSMTNFDKNRYMLSLMGLIKERNYVHRIKARGPDDMLSFRTKNSILKMMQRLQDVERDHQPNDKGLGHWVGVEVECIIPHRDGDGDGCSCEYDADGELENECNSCSNGDTYWSEEDAHEWLKGELLKAGVSRCCVKSDGSLNDDDGHGVEVTILFNSSYGFEPLNKLCKALTKAGCYVNKSCGLHVHLDARHLTKKGAQRIGDSLGHSLPVLKYLVPKSRHNNTYCKLGVSKLIRCSRMLDNWDERYHAVNLTAYPKYKTIEVRLHGGSINASKIESWVKLLKLIGNAKLKRDLYTFQDLADVPGIPESLIEYAEGRITELNPDAWPILIPEIKPAPITVAQNEELDRVLREFGIVEQGVA
jgi:hypothetical protein